MSENQTTPNRTVVTKPIYTHAEQTIEYQGIHAQIMKDGKTKLTKPTGPPDDDGIIDYDEIIIPAALVFKLNNLLKSGRIVSYGMADTDTKS